MCSSVARSQCQEPSPPFSVVIGPFNKTKYKAKFETEYKNFAIDVFPITNVFHSTFLGKLQ